MQLAAFETVDEFNCIAALAEGLSLIFNGYEIF
jgi:hypothetical protein